MWRKPLTKDDKAFKKKQNQMFQESKKAGIEMREHLTLKNDTLEADMYRQEQEKENQKKLKRREKKLPIGIQKMRKKVREVYDEEDDDDYLDHIKQPQAEETQLLNALNDEEKRNLKQRETIDIIKKEQDAGKMEALHIAHNFAKETGMKGLNEKAAAKGMQEALFDPNQTKDTFIEQNVTKKKGRT